ncbi:hypothetical protein AYI70_g5859 [Smittium culicis]|uniref:Uncharacterized protein n=1 Tax=Smittium culicis TaxID=133412 RepID=A0A1R1XSN2_9FUNG|nr:hypothetical protein AYI70_g5859 [Smittium culicis]
MQKRKTVKAFNLTSKKPIGMFKKQNEEQKKQIEAEETAKVFEEFVAVFDVDENKSKAFVRAGVEFDGSFSFLPFSFPFLIIPPHLIFSTQ